ncbi:MAG: thioredoxin-disulfide reductase [Christensenellales bacterium]|jgi:thioredoxin reductase (NADPH)|nr:thioredoxin-disulfide reductase [Clostridiales bacterium]
MTENMYDVIIIGAGPAGLSAAIYTGRARLKTLIIEKDKDGGQIVITSEIDNYPGSLEDESGPSLVERMVAQAARHGAEKVYDTVISCDLKGDIKRVICKKAEYTAHSVIIAAGAHPRPIGCTGEQEFIGKGVSYCATCDADFFEDMDIYVVGGGDTAVEEAMYLTKFGRQVTLIHRRDQLRAIKSIQDRAFANKKLNYMWDTVVTELRGDGILESMTVKNVKTGEETVINANEDDGTFGLFGFVGFIPETEIFKDQLNLRNGYIVTDDNMHTEIQGVFAAGDIREKSLRQVITAAADGAIAAMEANAYIEGYCLVNLG